MIHRVHYYGAVNDLVAVWWTDRMCMVLGDGGCWANTFNPLKTYGGMGQVRSPMVYWVVDGPNVRGARWWWLCVTLLAVLQRGHTAIAQFRPTPGNVVCNGWVTGCSRPCVWRGVVPWPGWTVLLLLLVLVLAVVVVVTVVLVVPGVAFVVVGVLRMVPLPPIISIISSFRTTYLV